MKHKKKMNRRERIADYINQRMEGFSKVPNVLADRALKIGALSFLALFQGSHHIFLFEATPDVCSSDLSVFSCSFSWKLYGKADGFSKFYCMVSRYVAVWNRICVPSAMVWGEKGI